MRLLLILLVSIATLVALPAPASAQRSTSITISPLRTEAEVAPGFIFSGNFTVINSGSDQQTIELSAETFNVTNQSYDYLFKADTPEASWVTFSKSTLVLQKDERVEIRYHVNVPLSAEPGGYYLALFATHSPSVDSSAGITPTERVASLLYLSVTGEASRAGKLIQLNSPSVVFTSTDWSTLLQNTGTLHYRSKYTVATYTLFDQQLSSREDSRLVLPNSVRLIEGSFDRPELLGIYKVVYTIGLGDTPAEEHSRWFLYLPPLQTSLIICILAGLFVLLKQRRSS
jgi:hypothetical protein